MNSLSETDAVVLVGGQGTRLRAVLADRPKPLAEVAGRPFLTYVLDALVEAGVRRVTLCTGYRGEMVQATFGQYYGPLRLTYSPEPQPLGTAGAVWTALPMLKSPTILVTNGDSLCCADLRAFARFHQQRACNASLLLTHVPDASRFGRVELDEKQRVTRFAEKDPLAAPGWINAGVYLIEQSALAGFAGTPLSLERDVFPELIGEAAGELPGDQPHGRICGWPSGGAFLDIGTPESLAQAEEFLSQHASAFSAAPLSANPAWRAA